MFRFFKSDSWNFEAVRLLGSTSADGCDVAEFLEAIGKIRQHDPESWYSAWHQQSQRAEAIAREAISNGHRDSAKRALLRASNYARASGYMLPWSAHDDKRLLATSERSVSLFREVIPYMAGRVMVLEIPYQGDLVMPAYLYLPPASQRLGGHAGGKDTPVIVNCGGADSTQEELYYAFAHNGTKLGYAVLTFEGPGQGMMLKRHKLAMRPDFEAVSVQVLDYIQRLADNTPELGLDPDRIAIMGGSMGAYYALRTSIDPRIKACVSIDPFYGLWRLAVTRIPGWFAKLWTSGWLPDSVFNGLAYMQMKVDFPSRWESELGMAMMGTSTPGDTLRRFQQFDLDVAFDGGEGVLDRIRCPVMLTGASNTLYASADESTVAIYNALSRVPEGKKEVWIPEEIGNGGLTGKVGAWGLLAQRGFQFLDKHLKIERNGGASDTGNGHST